MKSVIKIYDVAPEAITKVDLLAKEKGLSRSAYLKEMLESFSYLSAFNDYESRYRELALKLGAALENVDKTLRQYHTIYD